MIRPGDLIVADGSGVACIPADKAAQVLELARQNDADDKKAMQEMQAGLSFTEALQKFKRI